MKISGVIPAPVPPCFAPSLAWHPCRSCSLRSRFPRVAPGGFCALVPSAAGGRKGSLRRFAPLPPSSLPALRARPLRRCRWGGGFGVPSRRCPALPAPVSAAPCGGGVDGSLRSRVRFVGVCRGLSVSLCRFRSGGFRGPAFGPLSGRAVGRFRLGFVVPPFASLAVRVRRGRAVFLVRRRVALCVVLGSAASRPPRLLRRARGGRWLRGVGSRLPVRAAVPVGLARPGGRSCRLEAVWKFPFQVRRCSMMRVIAM